MSDSDFWRDLAAQFVLLASDPDREKVSTQFEVLSRRGAAHFNPIPTGDLMAAWIEAIRARKKDSYPKLFKPDRRALCDFSADFCSVMEREALEGDRIQQASPTPQVIRPAPFQNVRHISPVRLEPVGPVKLRLPGYINSFTAARKVDAFLREKNIMQKDFAIQVQCDERTLRRFRKTGKIRRDTLFEIAKKMNTSIEQLQEKQ
jgi:hypothetical protein